MLRVSQWSVVAGMAVVMAGCGGGSGGGGGTTGAGVPGAGVPVVTSGLFAQSLFTFDSDVDYSGEVTQQRIIRSTYSKSGDVVRAKDEIVAGPAGLSVPASYTVTKTTVYKTEAAEGGQGTKVAVMADSTVNSFTFAPYSVSEDKTGGLITFGYETKPLSGLLLADSLSPIFLMAPNGPEKLKHLRDSGRTFPTGSEGLVVRSATYQEDTVEFDDEDMSLATSFEEVFHDMPAGTKYDNYTFKDMEVRCVQDAELPVHYQSCLGSYKGHIYVVTVTPKGMLEIPAGLQMYFNPTAATALTDGIKADYK